MAIDGSRGDWFSRPAETVAGWCKRRRPAYNLSPVDKTFMLIGSVAALIGVGFGAFGAHGLRGRLSPEMLAVFETGVRYQMYHAFALLITALALARFDGWLLRTAGWLFTAGIVLFSGSLYALALSGVTVLGAITPLGGWRFSLAGLLHHRGDLIACGVRPSCREHEDTTTRRRTKKNQATESPRHGGAFRVDSAGAAKGGTVGVAPRHEPTQRSARLVSRCDPTVHVGLRCRPSRRIDRTVRFAIVAPLLCVSVPPWQSP